MAKLVYLILLLLFIFMPVYGTSFYLGFDLVSVDSFFVDGDRVGFDFCYRFLDFRVSIPVSYCFCLDDALSALDIGLRVDYYPFKDIDLFFGVDAVRYIRFFGLSSPEERNLFLSSLSVGYTIDLPYSYIEPRVIAHDPARLSEGARDVLDDHFPFYYDFYGQLIVGVRF